MQPLHRTYSNDDPFAYSDYALAGLGEPFLPASRSSFPSSSAFTFLPPPPQPPHFAFNDPSLFVPRAYSPPPGTTPFLSSPPPLDIPPQLDYRSSSRTSSISSHSSSFGSLDGYVPDLDIPASRGKHRRTPTYRAAREQTSPYLRRSSTASSTSSFGDSVGERASVVSDGLEGCFAGLFSSSAPVGEEAKLMQTGSVLNDATGSSGFVRPAQVSFPPPPIKREDDEDAELAPAVPSNLSSRRPSQVGWSADGSASSSTRVGSASQASSTPVLSAAEWRKVKATADALAAAAQAFHNATTATATDKARNLFVQTWLTQSYEIVEGSTVARQALYGSFCQAAEAHGIKPLNSASFGKAVRQAFPTLKTRRLGTRGHSRYHLCSFAASNPLEAAWVDQIEEECKAADSSDSASSASEESSTEDKAVPSEDEGEPLVEASSSYSRRSNPRSLSISIPPGDAPFDTQKTLVDATTAVPTLFAPRPVQPPPSPPATQLPSSFPQASEALNRAAAEGRSLPEKLWFAFSSHCSELLSAAKDEVYDRIQPKILSWWTSLSVADVGLLQNHAVIPLVCRAQAVVFEHILLRLHDKVTSGMPDGAFTALQSLAANIESVQVTALARFSQQDLVAPCVELAARFAQLLSLQLGLRKLSQALDKILAKPGICVDLARAWDETDFAFIKNHAALVSNVAAAVLDTAFEDFGRLFRSPTPLTAHAAVAWVEARWKEHAANVVSTRSTLVKISFVAELFMRDLTSSPLFGAFQVMHLLFLDLLSFRVLLDTCLKSTPTSSPPPSRFSPPPLSFAPLPASANLIPVPLVPIPVAGPSLLEVPPPPPPAAPTYFGFSIKPATPVVPVSGPLPSSAAAQYGLPFPSPSSSFFPSSSPSTFLPAPTAQTSLSLPAHLFPGPATSSSSLANATTPRPMRTPGGFAPPSPTAAMVSLSPLPGGTRGRWGGWEGPEDWRGM
ncbi:hypothetical protein JCM10207_002437 [Rhodosporidiobolus poonsookiae]